MMTADKIRSAFLEFFRSKGHSIIASDTVVPKNDPTVLFTTAGMQQFKRQFLGHLEGYTRAATSQKCLRTDDLDRVGKTAFHHTFFEMLGNFSFGDYFKKEAIAWGWEFLTKHMRIPAERLWVSVYKDDDEAYNIWRNDIKIPADRIVKLGDKSNFWPSEAKQNGPNGPCGPCSEIFFDYGKNPDCPNGDKCDPDCNCGRFAEVWNLVFTQYNRKDGGVLEPLPAKNIDTGMGLERLCAVVQGKKSNYETDLFTPILQAIDDHAKKQNIVLPERNRKQIADHLRAVIFAINDGVIPSNKERGSVVKRLINDMSDMILRAQGKPFLSELVPVVIAVMKAPYPELVTKAKDIAMYVQKTQADYEDVFSRRLPELASQIEKAANDAEKIGELMFYYRDTLGLTGSTIRLTVQKSGIASDILDKAQKISEEKMTEQQDRSRASSKMQGDVFLGGHVDVKGLPKTAFLGYKHEQMKSSAKILKIFKDNQEVGEAQKGDSVTVVLDQTPFYAESGGQIGDKGTIAAGPSKVRVDDTQKDGDVVLHIGEIIEGSLKTDCTVEAAVDEKRRLDIMRNHTATHLLQAALRKVLGSHVQQQGSVVDNERLRFDFTHPAALKPEQIQAIENFVYEAVLACQPVVKESLSLEEAKKRGALAFFAEKYGSTVRVVSIEGTSKELCGGTHLNCTGEVGLFKIVSESAIAQGIRRIEAKTGWGALDWMNAQTEQLQKIGRDLKVATADVPMRVTVLLNQKKQLEKSLIQERYEKLKDTLAALIGKGKTIKGIKIITNDRIFGEIDMELLRKLLDEIRQLAPKSHVIILGGENAGAASLLIGISDDVVAKGVLANDVIREVASLIQGSGGGRPNMAQAGGKDSIQLWNAIQKAQEMIEKKLITS